MPFPWSHQDNMVSFQTIPFCRRHYFCPRILCKFLFFSHYHTVGSFPSQKIVIRGSLDIELVNTVPVREIFPCFLFFPTIPVIPLRFMFHEREVQLFSKDERESWSQQQKPQWKQYIKSQCFLRSSGASGSCCLILPYYFPYTSLHLFLEMIWWWYVGREFRKHRGEG